MNEFAQAYQNLALPGGQIAPYDPKLNQQVAGFSPYQQQGIQQIADTSAAAAPLGAAGARTLEGTLSGQYLDPATNPYLRGTYDDAARAMTEQYTNATAPGLAAEAQRAGAYGGSAYDQAAAMQRYGLGQNLGSLANQIYGGNYQAERDRMQQGLGMLGQTEQALYQPAQQLLGAGTIQQQQEQLGYDTQFQNALRQQQYPYTVLDELGQALSVARGPSGQSHSYYPIRSGTMGFK